MQLRDGGQHRYRLYSANTLIRSVPSRFDNKRQPTSRSLGNTALGVLGCMNGTAKTRDERRMGSTTSTHDTQLRAFPHPLLGQSHESVIQLPSQHGIVNVRVLLVIPGIASVGIGDKVTSGRTMIRERRQDAGHVLRMGAIISDQQLLGRHRIGIFNNRNLQWFHHCSRLSGNCKRWTTTSRASPRWSRRPEENNNSAARPSLRPNREWSRGPRDTVVDEADVVTWACAIVVSTGYCTQRDPYIHCHWPDGHRRYQLPTTRGVALRLGGARG